MKISFEKVISDSGSSFAVKDRKERAFQGIYHFHPEIELTQIVGGTGVRLVGDDISPFRDGDLVLIGANLPHRYTSDPGGGGAWSRARVIQFSEESLGGGVLHAPECREIVHMLENASRGLSFGGKTAESADEILQRLFARGGFSRLHTLLKLLHTLSTSSDATPVSSSGYIASINTFESDKVNLALDYIHRHMHEPLTMDQMADCLKVSPATCNRLFRKSLGKPFKAFLLEVRISHACKLLLETDANIISIAHDCGFFNLSNFNRQFKAHKGKTPREFRARAVR
jgi:AraC-like DNA-binding protein